MKNFDLNSMGVHEMNTLEMQETDGGIIWLIVAGVALLCGGCIQNVEFNVQVGDNNKNVQMNTQNMDSTLNGNTPNLSLPPIGTPSVSVNPNW